MRRRPTAELLDADAGTPDEVASSLEDIRLVNRWFGGATTTLALIEHVLQARPRNRLSLLEVAAGSGEVPAFAREKLQLRGIHLDATLLDRHIAHVRGNRTRRVAADALALPFRDGSFDLVSCGLFAHHLSP